MVRGTAADQFRVRARKALERGESFVARGEVNKAILEEVRAELQQEVAAGRKSVQSAASAGKKKVEAAGEDWVKRIQLAGEEALHKVKRARKDKSARGSSEAQPKKDTVSEAVATGQTAEVNNVSLEKTPKEELTHQLAVVQDQNPFAMLQDITDPTVRLFAQTRHTCKPALADAFARSVSPEAARAQLEQEYKEACASAQKGVIRLQELSLEVQRQRQVAREERIGYVHHEGYKAAVLAFRKLHSELLRHDFVDQRWILDCQRQADLVWELGTRAVDPSCLDPRPLARAVGMECDLVWWPKPAGPRVGSLSF